MEKNRVRIALRVQDSKITAKPDQPWTGSCVELFFARESGKAIRQIFIVPGPGKKKPVALDAQRRPISGVRIRQTVAGTHYDLDVTLPLKVAGLAGGARTFLFDAIFDLAALGDAHSGGRAALNGKFDSSSLSAHYSRVVG